MVNSRNKGLSFERKVVSLLKPLFPDAERAMVGSELDNSGVDIRNTGALAIQCKKHKNYAPINTLSEIKTSKIKTLVTAGDRKEPVIVMPLADFIKIAMDIGELYDRDASGVSSGFS